MKKFGKLHRLIMRGWQKNNAIKANNAINKYNLGFAVRRAEKLGRPLTNQELSSFKREKYQESVFPTRKLVIEGSRYFTI